MKIKYVLLFLFTITITSSAFSQDIRIQSEDPDSMFYSDSRFYLIQSSDDENQFGIPVFAGAEAKTNCPVIVSLGETDLDAKSLSLSYEDETIPAQIFVEDGETKLAFIIPAMDAFEKRLYIIKDESTDSDTKVTVSKKGETALDIQIGGQLFTTYHIESTDKVPRPILYPVIGPSGARMTRGYPMDPKQGERQDHPHHQSIWVSHGDVSGHNFWHLDDEMGYQNHQAFNQIVDGPVMARLDSTVNWDTHEDKTLLEERRIITIWGLEGQNRMIDFDITLTATDEDVVFGDTKEGGLISVRIATSMDENQREEGKEGGKIVNANGLVGERNAWGKASRWCDYSGPVDGITAGITIMDHPSNPFYPTRYHVRNYGLFTANPFGLSHFIDNSHDGTQVLQKGDSWNLKYRLYFHEGDLEQANVADHYEDYAGGAQVFVK